MLRDSQPGHSHCRSIRVNRSVLIKHILGYLIAIEDDHLAAKEIETNDIAYDFTSKLMTSMDLLTSRTMSSPHAIEQLPR